MQNKGLFVTGTDTGVGKTLVAAGLLLRLKEQGINAAPMKPVQTGCRETKAGYLAPDLDFCLKAAGISDLHDPAMSLYLFKDACSPHLAAEREGIDISIPEIKQNCKNLLKKHEFLVVEGAGGVNVPLSREAVMLDLMVALGFPVVLVARPNLGTINHTLMSLKVLRDVNLKVACVFVNYSSDTKTTYIEEDNIKTIKENGRVKKLFTLPFLQGSFSSLIKQLADNFPTWTDLQDVFYSGRELPRP